MLHARGDFLTDEAAFLEVDAVQLLEPGIESEDRVGRQVGAVRHTEVKLMGAVRRRLGAGKRALDIGALADAADAEARRARIGESGETVLSGKLAAPERGDSEASDRHDVDLGAQA